MQYYKKKNTRFQVFYGEYCYECTSEQFECRQEQIGNNEA